MVLKLTEPQEIALHALVRFGPAGSVVGSWRTVASLLNKGFIRKVARRYVVTRLGQRTYEGVLRRRARRQRSAV